MSYIMYSTGVNLNYYLFYFSQFKVYITTIGELFSKTNFFNTGKNLSELFYKLKIKINVDKE